MPDGIHTGSGSYKGQALPSAAKDPAGRRAVLLGRAKERKPLNLKNPIHRVEPDSLWPKRITTGTLLTAGVLLAIWANKDAFGAEAQLGQNTEQITTPELSEAPRTIEFD